MYKTGILWGGFDLFHFGHLELIRKMKEKCGKLVVCVSDDEYIFEKKGHFPTISLDQRVAIVSAIKYVDTVDIQSFFFTKQNAVDFYKPDVIGVGSDWEGRGWDGEKLGLPIIYFPYTKGISSTILRKTI